MDLWQDVNVLLNITHPGFGLGVIFPKRQQPKSLKDTQISTQQNFFCIVVSTCQRRDRFNENECTFITQDDNYDKMMNILVGVK